MNTRHKLDQLSTFVEQVYGIELNEAQRKVIEAVITCDSRTVVHFPRRMGVTFAAKLARNIGAKG